MFLASPHNLPSDDSEFAEFMAARRLAKLASIRKRMSRALVAKDRAAFFAGGAEHRALLAIHQRAAARDSVAPLAVAA